jgi:uncharacterized damage-inducible protein DinB
MPCPGAGRFSTLACVHPVLALFRHNAWATERLLEFCEGRPETTAPAERDVYGGIVPMFNHILSGETGYLRLVTGELPKDRVRESSPRALADLKEPARWLAQRWSAVLDGERDPEPVLLYQRGDDAEVMADWVPLAQCVHHGDDHRTQVATLLDRHGVEPPRLDGWTFAAGTAAAGSWRPWWAALLRRVAGHHHWATERLLEHCRALTPEQLALSAPGTSGSISDILDRLVSFDRSYLASLAGGGDWLAYLDSGPDFEAVVKSGDAESPAWVLVLQALHHGNRHRTHAGTILLNHQLEAPDIDVWSYAWAEGALKPLD